MDANVVEDSVLQIIIDSGEFVGRRFEFQGRRLDDLSRQEADDVLSDTGFLPDWGNVPNLLFVDPGTVRLESDGAWTFDAEGLLEVPVRATDAGGNILYFVARTGLDLAEEMCLLTQERYL